MRWERVNLPDLTVLRRFAGFPPVGCLTASVTILYDTSGREAYRVESHFFIQAGSGAVIPGVVLPGLGCSLAVRIPGCGKPGPMPRFSASRWHLTDRRFLVGMEPPQAPRDSSS